MNTPLQRFIEKLNDSNWSKEVVQKEFDFFLGEERRAIVEAYIDGGMITLAKYKPELEDEEIGNSVSIEEADDYYCEQYFDSSLIKVGSWIWDHRDQRPYQVEKIEFIAEESYDDYYATYKTEDDEILANVEYLRLATSDELKRFNII